MNFCGVTKAQTGCVPSDNGRKTDEKNVNINGVDIHNINTIKPQLIG